MLVENAASVLALLRLYCFGGVDMLLFYLSYMLNQKITCWNSDPFSTIGIRNLMAHPHQIRQTPQKKDVEPFVISSHSYRLSWFMNSLTMVYGRISKESMVFMWL